LFNEDSNGQKVDLGVGVYKNTQGNTPILKSIKQAEKLFFDQEQTKVYTAPEGVSGFNENMEALIFGEEHTALKDGRIASVQTPGGCGALRLAAELVMRVNPSATLWLSDPSWGNHRPLLGDAGIKLADYPYYDTTNSCIKFDEMIDTLSQASKGDIVLIHASCHNPTGADLSKPQWDAIAELAVKQGFIPFVDMAYQGFATDVDEDAYGIRTLASRVPELLVSTSCSKNFALYRERVGAISVMSDSAESALKAKRQLMSIARGMYSMPPAHGAALVSVTLSNQELKAQWLEELAEMRNRIKQLRKLLLSNLETLELTERFSFIEKQNGMFSFLGLSVEQVQRMRNDFSVYMTDNSRINIAGINENNVEYLASSINQTVNNL
jgi:aspartate aminotransferase